MSRPGLVIVDAPTLMEGAPQLLAQATVAWWLAQEDHVRPLLELLHQRHGGDLVATPEGVVML